MKLVGVVSEYNPFHRGHRYHLEHTRAMAGECAILCVMSGHWVQRGDCALTDKWSRAAAALRGGADLVVELPTPWAMSSAEHFARGAVRLLSAAGVDAISFGSEAGDAEPLRWVAACLDSAEYGEQLRLALDKGVSFAAARQEAVTALLGREAGELLSGPNNSLGVEYLRALDPSVAVLTVPRLGPGHNGGTEGDMASATAIRALVRQGEGAEPYLTEPLTGQTADLARCERAVLARLRSMTEAHWLAIPDSGEGLANRLVEAARQGTTLEEVWSMAKSKRYALARLRRLTLWAWLGMTAADRPEEGPGYLRLLGCTPRGREVLAGLRETCPIPVITKAADHKALLAAESRRTDLYALCLDAPWPCGREFTTPPIILK